MQLGAIWMPAPTSPNSAERSSTRTLRPLRARANAADRPPMPPPTTMTSGRPDFTGGRLPCASRLSFSASKTGESLKRNRSSALRSESVAPASDLAENGCQDGTTNRSPRLTDQVLSPTVTVPEPSKTV